MYHLIIGHKKSQVNYTSQFPSFFVHFSFQILVFTNTIYQIVDITTTHFHKKYAKFLKFLTLGNIAQSESAEIVHSA